MAGGRAPPGAGLNSRSSSVWPARSLHPRRLLGAPLVVVLHGTNALPLTPNTSTTSTPPARQGIRARATRHSWKTAPSATRHSHRARQDIRGKPPISTGRGRHTTPEAPPDRGAAAPAGRWIGRGRGQRWAGTCGGLGRSVRASRPARTRASG